MNSKYDKDGEPTSGIDVQLEEVKRAVAESSEALNRLRILAYQNEYGASALYEFTCSSCQKLGDVLTDFPALKEIFREWRSYYPVIIAEDLDQLDPGLRELAIQGERAQKSRLKKLRRSKGTHIEYPRNLEARSAESIFNLSLRHFTSSVLREPRNNPPWIDLTAQKVPQHVKDQLLDPEWRYKKGEWASHFVECLSPRLLANKEPNEADREIVWEEWGDQFPDGVLYRYGVSLMFKVGKPTSIGNRTKDPIYALKMKAEGMMEALIGIPPDRKKKKVLKSRSAG